MRQLRIVFMGTPEFAVPSLEILVKTGFHIVGVITAPDKPKGRGRQLAASPVKKFAMDAGLNILQPKNLKDPEFQDELRALDANLQVVVAFRMLPETVWAMPEIGTFNLHASLLPQYRGAAPINWVLINGETETGATTFFIRHEIDTGEIIFQQKEPIYEEDTAGSLYERLMHLGAGLVLKTVKAIENNEITPVAQIHSTDLKTAPKIFTETCEINWNQPAKRIYDFIRGLSPYPGAWMRWKNDQIIKIFKTSITSLADKSNPGSIRTDNKNELFVKASDYWLKVNELQLQGKRRMFIDEFLRGNKIE